MVPLYLRLLELHPLLWLIAVSSSLSPSSSLSSDEARAHIAKPGCNNRCGKIYIPYPFGIGANCSYNASYEVVCRNDSIPFLQYYNLELTDISWTTSDLLYKSNFHGMDQTLTVLTHARDVCRKDGVGMLNLDLEGSPYQFSSSNVFMVVGCGGSALLKNRSGGILTGCASLCASGTAATNMEAANCFGVGCCRSAFGLDQGLRYYELGVDYHTTAAGSKTCTLIAGLINGESAEKIAHLRSFPTVLDWSFSDFRSGGYTSEYDHLSCSTDYRGAALCWCDEMYKGNPYIPGGCQIVEECRKCKHHCRYDYDPKASRLHYYCVNPLLQRGPILGFSIGVGSVLLLLCSFWLYRVVKRKREAKRKAKYFKRNGGLLLQQHMSSGEGAFTKTKLFRVTELEKATNNFSKKRILGQGGQGTVYKGMLTDGKIVAIKKSKLVDEGQLEQFINEVVVLSEINHRNVVKLLGCCLETEVPLLVYEFIPNGTVYDLLHAPSDELQITWKMRLQIASESADALAYLHSSSATPIYHRDIKSSNILLDKKYRAKVSDFGTSRSITIEQTHVTTCVIGTYGYLDPEYFRSNQFTEKSDVYSFGVVLAELITGKKPVFQTESREWISLASEFLSHMEASSIYDILDARVLEEGKEEELIAVANLAKQCLNMSGKERPSMKEIAVVLDGIRSQKVPSWKETQCVVSETSDLHYTPSCSNTSIWDDNPGSYRSIDVQPLMPNTF